MSHLVSDWIEWDGKYMSAFALPGDGGDEREHEDHGIVRKVEAFVQKHWGLPRVVTNLGILWRRWKQNSHRNSAA